MDLTTHFLGHKLKNPLFLSAGPTTGSGEAIAKAIEAGVGGVVTKTIVNEIRPNVRPRLAAQGNGMVNIELYSEFTVEEWEEEIEIALETAEKHGAMVIANIMAHSPSEMAYLAKRVERFGVHGVELGVSIPHGEGLEVIGSNPATVYEYTKAVVDKVKIPVIVKLSPNVNNISKLALAAERAGASAISTIDTVRAIIGVDVERHKPILPIIGGYSGPAIRPIGLASVATISQTVKIPVAGIGGIENYRNILEYLMLGATVVQFSTAAIWHGLEIIRKMLEDLSNWLELQNYRNWKEIIGAALPALKSFEEVKVEPYIASVESHLCKACGICSKACLYQATEIISGKSVVYPEMCDGCGICVDLCPAKARHLTWGE